jgi:hypothetical protein
VDEGQVDLNGPAGNTFSGMIPLTLAIDSPNAASGVDILCSYTSGGTATIKWAKITAIQVETLANTAG